MNNSKLKETSQRGDKHKNEWGWLSNSNEKVAWATMLLHTCTPAATDMAWRVALPWHVSLFNNTSNKHKWSILEKKRVVGYAAKADTMIENSQEMQDD